MNLRAVQANLDGSSGRCALGVAWSRRQGKQIDFMTRGAIEIKLWQRGLHQ
jgi:hypothetical protein